MRFAGLLRCDVWKTNCSAQTPPYPWGYPAGTCTESNHNSTLSGKGCGTGLTDAVDARPKGKSPYALYAMKGDVFTWLADWYDSGYYDSAPGTNPQGPASSPSGEKSMRGLGWSDAMEPAWTRWKYDPKAVSSTIGVRCAY